MSYQSRATRVRSLFSGKETKSRFGSDSIFPHPNIHEVTPQPETYGPNSQSRPKRRRRPSWKRPAAPANRPKDPRFDPTTAAFFSATRGQHVISSKLRLLSTWPTIPNLASIRPWLGFRRFRSARLGSSISRLRWLGIQIIHRFLGFRPSWSHFWPYIRHLRSLRLHACLISFRAYIGISHRLMYNGACPIAFVCTILYMQHLYVLCFFMRGIPRIHVYPLHYFYEWIEMSRMKCFTFEVLWWNMTCFSCVHVAYMNYVMIVRTRTFDIYGRHDIRWRVTRCIWPSQA